MTATEVVCAMSSVLAEILAYVTIAAYTILIVRTVNGREPGVYVSMTTLAPAAILFTKIPALIGLIAKHVSLLTGALFFTSVTVSWTLQAMFMGQIIAGMWAKVTLALLNITLMLYFLLSTSRFSRKQLYDKCKSGIFF